jgi:phosphopentomutase
MCAVAPGCLPAQSKPAFATTHGAPWAYDQRVPVLFLGPGIKSGTVHRRVSPADVAPTLCARFGLVEPSVCRGTPIGEALK